MPEKCSLTLPAELLHIICENYSFKIKHLCSVCILSGKFILVGYTTFFDYVGTT
jgi:hypothetical protein